AGFQKFIVGSLYGWQDSEGYKRFTKAYISLSRKNGKTLLVSGLGLYEMLMGDDPVNERLIGLSANSRDQAGIAYDMTYAQLSVITRIAHKIIQLTKVKTIAKVKLNMNYRSKIKAVSNEADNLEGHQFNYAIIDVYHEDKDKKIYETLRRGQV